MVDFTIRARFGVLPYYISYFANKSRQSVPGVATLLVRPRDILSWIGLGGTPGVEVTVAEGHSAQSTEYWIVSQVTRKYVTIHSMKRSI
jgi:hypothetical protein